MNVLLFAVSVAGVVLASVLAALFLRHARERLPRALGACFACLAVAFLGAVAHSSIFGEDIRATIGMRAVASAGFAYLLWVVMRNGHVDGGGA